MFHDWYHNILWKMFHVKHKYRAWKNMYINVSRETLNYLLLDIDYTS